MTNIIYSNNISKMYKTFYRTYSYVITYYRITYKILEILTSRSNIVENYNIVETFYLYSNILMFKTTKKYC